MKKRSKTPIEQQTLCERPSIEMRPMEFIQKEIDIDKELAEKDITKFCRDKAIELLHGCQVSGDRLIVTGVSPSERVDLLKLLATLGAVN